MSVRAGAMPVRLWALTRHPTVSLGDVQYAAGVRGVADNWLARHAIRGGVSTALAGPRGSAVARVVRSLDLGPEWDWVAREPLAVMTRDEFARISAIPPRRSRTGGAPDSSLRRRNTPRGDEARTLFLRFTSNHWDHWRDRPMPLTDDVYRWFGLVRDPFAKPATDGEVYRNSDFRAKERQLTQAIRAGAYVAVMGPSGGGKTQLVRAAVRSLTADGGVVFSRLLSPDTRRISEHSLISCMFFDFTESLARQIKPGSGVEMRMRALRTAVRAHADEGRMCCLIVEEAHGLTYFIPQLLKRIREAVEDGFRERLAVVLIGQDDSSATTCGRPMDLMLIDPMMREVGRRLTPIRLRPLGRTLTSYIDHRIRLAGSEPEMIFDKSVLPAVRRRLRGDLLVPQAVDSLLSGAMRRAHEMGDPIVTGAHVDDAACGRAAPAAVPDTPTKQEAA